MENKTWTYW